MCGTPGILEDAKSTFNIEDYELTQTTLESIFCKLARDQLAEDDQKRAQASRSRNARRGLSGLFRSSKSTDTSAPSSKRQVHMVELASVVDHTDFEVEEGQEDAELEDYKDE